VQFRTEPTSAMIRMSSAKEGIANENHNCLISNAQIDIFRAIGRTLKLMNKRPRIGITMRLEMETRRFYLGRDYSEAIQAASAVPVQIPLIPDREYIDELIAELDGILLPGSDSDVDPVLYGEEPHPNLKNVVPEKDETDRLVFSAAEARGLPVLGICYGMQAINVARGGSLVQDIESQIENALKHNQGRPLDRHSHSIEIDRESRLGRMETISSNGDSVRVNSHHHQSIARLGQNLRAVGWSTDGIVECFEDDRPEKFVLGVQWHPELAWDRDPLSRDIFSAFIDECRKTMET
jgi:putative glutamine amidotransferase